MRWGGKIKQGRYAYLYCECDVVESCCARCEFCFSFGVTLTRVGVLGLNINLNIARKPRNARSKRALEAREPKEVEDVRTAVFVRGTHEGEVVKNAMKELVREPALVGRACAQRASCVG